MRKLDFLAIGDTTVDAFIKIKDASVHCSMNHDDCELCMKFGSKVPFENLTEIYAVGNSANASVTASKLGLFSALATTVGKDENGKRCIKELDRKGVVTKFISRQKGVATNYHYVLWYESERTILVNHRVYNYTFPRLSHAPKWIYLSSLGANSEKFMGEVMAYLEKNPETKLAFQPGTFQINLGVEKLAGLYRRSEVCVMNLEEAEKITGKKEVKELLVAMRSLGPKIILITDGIKGSYMYDGGPAYFMKPYPDPSEPFERTGAGDAFSATFVSALALGKTTLEALTWAPINAMSVVQKVGAQAGLLSREELEAWLAKAPADYKPRQI